MIRYRIEFDAERLQGEQWIVVQWNRRGFSVIARFPTKQEALDYRRTIEGAITVAGRNAI